MQNKTHLYPYFFYTIAAVLLFSTSGTAKNIKPKPQEFRADCAIPTARVDLEVNNVRAKLRVGGSVWWDDEGKSYIVPFNQGNNTDQDVSVIKAGGIWMGGRDPAGNLKIACQTDDLTNGKTDFYAGPLSEYGITNQSNCENWDRFFSVKREEIDEHLHRYEEAQDNQSPYLESDIPASVKGWPAIGNPYFESIYGFSLPNFPQGLAPFFDRYGDGIYDPSVGDYPVLEYWSCNFPTYADEMVFWVFNDAGGPHTVSGGDAIQMEIQALAYSWKTLTPERHATFYRFRTINRAVESIDDFHFGLWMDPDLGCGEDDYIGCLPEENLAYVYNADALDGDVNGACGTTNAYKKHAPIFAIEQDRGFLNEFGAEINMSSFTYYSASAGSVPGNRAPQTAAEYYNLLKGNWTDGTRMTSGGTGYNPGSTDFTTYAFPGTPDDASAWSMCSENLPAADQQFVLSHGPIRLDPGAVNEASYTLQWIDQLDYPCPDINRLLTAKAARDCVIGNCHIHYDFLDAPDVDIRSGDQRLVLTLSNDRETSTNYQEQFEVAYCETLAPGVGDPYYRFEGYQIYQLHSDTVNYFKDFDNPDLIRLVVSMDIQNGIKEAYNWPVFGRPFIDSVLLTPILMNPGAMDEGLLDSIEITEDLFATGPDRSLVNNKVYYYTVVAYAYNNYAPFEFENGLISGQHTQYMESRRNVKTYAAIPQLKGPDCENSNNQLGLQLYCSLGPNPFSLSNGPDNLRLFNVPAKGTINMYNILGKELTRIDLDGTPCEMHSYAFSKNTLISLGVTTGLYFFSIQSPGFNSQTLKCLIVD